MGLRDEGYLQIEVGRFDIIELDIDPDDEIWDKLQGTGKFS